MKGIALAPPYERMRVLGTISLTLLLSACGSTPYEGPQPFSANSTGRYVLTEYNGLLVEADQAISVQIVSSTATAHSNHQHCSTDIKISTFGELLDAGLGSSHCFVEMAPDSFHSRFILDFKPDQIRVDESQFTMGLYEFTRQQ